MVIRTFQKKSNLKKGLLILLVMIIGIIIVAKVTNIIYTKITTQSGEKEREIGSFINFAGEIESDNNFPLYTHKITNNTDKIFIKSSIINLNKYSGDIEIYGEVKDIKKGIPVVDLVSIKFPEQGLVVKDNIYFFVKDMLYIDFSNQEALSAKKIDKDITVFYDENKLFSIERFLCSRVLRNKDCSYLIEDYGTSQKENFDSYRGYTYYKHSTGLRTVFDGTMFGYIFKNIEEETMLNISSMIKIIDKNFVLSNKINDIKSACESKGEIIDQIGSSTIQNEDNNKLSIIVDSAKSDKLCKVTFDMWNERKITQVKISKK